MFFVKEMKVIYRKVETQNNYNNVSFCSPENVVKLVREILGSPTQETFVSLYLDIKNRLIGYSISAIGTVDSCAVSPRDIFKGALLANASGLIVSHNHPSDDPTPSYDDNSMTQKISEIGKMLNIKLLDHVIVTDSNFYSFAAHNKL